MNEFRVDDVLAIARRMYESRGQAALFRFPVGKREVRLSMDEWIFEGIAACVSGLATMVANPDSKDYDRLDRAARGQANHWYDYGNPQQQTMGRIFRTGGIQAEYHWLVGLLLLAVQEDGGIDFSTVDPAPDLMGVNWSQVGISLAGINWVGVGWQITGCQMPGMNLRYSDFQSMDLEGSNFEGAFLWGSNFRGAHLKGVNFKDAYMVATNLEGANLEGANLSGANLSGAYMGRARLYGADLRGAKLNWVKDLDAADLRQALYKRKTVFPDGFDPAAAEMIRQG